MDVFKSRQALAPGSDKRPITELFLTQLLALALGALLGSAELLFGIRPFGVALAAASTLTFPAAALGAAIFALVAGDHFSLLALILTAVVRLSLSLLPSKAAQTELFCERLSFRVVTAAVAVFVAGLWRVIAGGFRYYDLFALLLLPAAAALATLLFSGVTAGKDALFRYSEEAGIAALVFTAVFSLRAVSFFGIYPAAVAAAGVSFLLVAHRGMLWGAVGGLLTGLCFDWKIAPAFLLCAVGFGLLEKSSRGGGIIAGSGAAAAYAFLLSGSAGITRLLPALLTAGALFLAGDSAGLVEGSATHRAGLARRRAALQSARAERQAASEARFNELSGALLDLSGTFFELSARLRRPGISDLRHLCDKSFDALCPTCRNRDLCWANEYAATAQAINRLAAILHAKGAVGREHLPSAMTSRCLHLPEILDRINEGALALSQEALRGDKTSVVATDYAALSRVVREALEGAHLDFEADTAAGERILERLSRLGYSLESVAVCGKRHRRVLLRGVRLPGRHIKLRELRGVLEQHCRFRLGEPTVTESDGVSDITFHEREHFSSTAVKQTRAKGRSDGRYCGDSVSALSTSAGLDYSLLCDGMGSGTSAALTSTLASTFLSRLLGAGNRADTSLRMLNGLLAARGAREAESSTTVDLLEIDRVSGEAALYKCGAAPSFLLRRGEVTRFFSRTAPIGILEALDAERLSFTVRAGDVIVQVSDGVTKGEEDCVWLADMLRTRWDGDGEAFARLLLGKAGGEGKDDLSVIITEIGIAPNGIENEQKTAQTA